MKTNTYYTFFTTRLMHWHQTQNDRIMPWKGSKNPYHIWLSEVILQQTQVAQGTAYFNRFINNYPTITDLANAKDEDVFKLWEGLGYYNRCRNLLHSARLIVERYNGTFPRDYSDIISLKGIGPYSAAAISSFAYNEPVAVVDGNVMRVFARYFGIKEPVDAKDTLAVINTKAQILLYRPDPAAYNQAIMDFGATICKPKNPACTTCVLQTNCFAFKHNLQMELPNKKPKAKRRVRTFIFVAIKHKNCYLIRKRGPGDIWQNLWEFVTIEPANIMSDEQMTRTVLPDDLPLKAFKIANSVQLPHQLLTHQQIQAKIITAEVNAKFNLAGYSWQTQQDITKLAFPGLLRLWIKNHIG